MLFSTYKRTVFYILLLAIVSGPFLVLPFFCHPLPGDDYHFALSSMTIGPWNTLLESYIHWTGRYFLCWILSLNPLIYGTLLTYQLSLFLLILAFPLTSYFLIRTYLKSLNSVQHIQGTVLFTFLYFYSLPNLNEGLFWFTGAVAYQCANILWMLYLIVIGFVLQSVYKSKRVIPAIFLAIILIFMIAGCNEISMAVLLSFNVIIYLRLILNNCDKQYLMFFVVLASLIAAVIVVAAPGNAIRTSLFPDHHNIFITAYMSLLGSAYYLMQWLFMTILISLYVVYIFNNALPVRNQAFNVPPRLSLSILGILLAVAFIVPAWATGQMPNPRAINVVFLFFIIGWMYNLLVLINYFNKKGAIPIPNKNHLIAVTLAVLLITFNPGKLVNNNIKYAWVALLTGEAQNYSKEMDQYQEEVRKGTAIIYPKSTFKPYCLYQNVVEDSAGIEDMHSYYRIKKGKF